MRNWLIKPKISFVELYFASQFVYIAIIGIWTQYNFNENFFKYMYTTVIILVYNFKINLITIDTIKNKNKLCNIQIIRL